MDSPQQCVPTHCFLRLEPSIVQATSFHQQLPLWMCLPLTHPSSLFSLRRDFSPPPDFRTVRNCPEPLSMRRRTAFLRQGCRILYIVGVRDNLLRRCLADLAILPIRLTQTPTRARVCPSWRLWTSTSATIWLSPNRSLSFSDFFPMTRRALPILGVPAGLTALSARIAA